MVSMAVYGEPISDVLVDSTPYEPRPLPVLAPVSLSSTLDLITPCHTSDVLSPTD